MLKLMEKSPVLHAVVWVVIYVTLVNVGDALSEMTKIAWLPTAVLLSFLSLVLTAYLKRGKGLGQLKLRGVSRQDSAQTLLYLPLIALAFIQFAAGLESSLSAADIAVICLLMAGTGYVEELLFRGLLFEGIRGKSGLNRAILISGVTFGLGHIVNLLRGYDAAQMAGQIVLAVGIGLVLALLIALTKNLMPGILFHIVFNISGSITKGDSASQTFIMIAVLAVALPYAAMLYSKLHKEIFRTAQA